MGVKKIIKQIEKKVGVKKSGEKIKKVETKMGVGGGEKKVGLKKSHQKVEKKYSYSYYYCSSNFEKQLVNKLIRKQHHKKPN